jgi:hypothetical protein
MSQDPNPDTSPELHIHSASDLFRYLQEGTPSEQTALLEAIANDPSLALEYAHDDNTTLLEELLLLEQDNPMLRVPTLYALMSLPPEPRLLKAFEARWTSTSQPEVMQALLGYFQDQGNTALLRESLHQNENFHKAALVATALVGHPDNTMPDRVRIAAISDSEVHEPLSADNLELWTAQLSHALAQRAYHKLEQQGQSAYHLLRTKHTQLDAQSQIWLLDWGWLVFQDREVLHWGLAHSSPELQNECLELLIEQPQTGFETALATLAASADPTMRERAIQAGADLDWQHVWQTETDNNVRLAILARLSDQHTLLETFLHPDWRFRAQAANRLIALGGVPQADLEPYLQHPQEEVRAAAARVMLETAE